MVNFKNLFRRQSTEVVPASTKSNGQADSPETQHDSTPPSDLNTSIPSSRSVEPSSVPAAQVYIPPPPNSHNSQHTAQNIGMAAGAVIGENNGSGMGMGMVEGMVGAGMINQQIQQHKSHAYWREQSANYQAGLPAAGVGDPRVAEEPSKHPEREERRRKRWERRAERRS